MPIAVQCPGCGGKFRAPDDAVRKEVKCPKCSAPIAVGGAYRQGPPQAAPAQNSSHSPPSPSARTGPLPAKPERHIGWLHAPRTRLLWRYLIPLTGIVLTELALILVALVQAASGVKHVVRAATIIDSRKGNEFAARDDVNECVLIIRTKGLSWHGSDIRLSFAGESRKPCFVGQTATISVGGPSASYSPVSSEAGFLVPKLQSDFVLDLGPLGNIPVKATGAIRTQYDLATNTSFPAVVLAVALPVLCVMLYVLSRLFTIKTRRMSRSVSTIL
jgi:hypothetical protein